MAISLDTYSIHDYTNYLIHGLLSSWTNLEDLSSEETDEIRRVRQQQKNWLISSGIKIDDEIIVIDDFDLDESFEIFETENNIIFLEELKFTLKHIAATEDKDQASGINIDIPGLFRYMSRVRKLLVIKNFDSNATQLHTILLEKLEFSLEELYEEIAALYDKVQASYINSRKLLVIKNNNSNAKKEDLGKFKFRPQQIAVLENAQVDFSVLECSICFELLFAPVALNCSHNFCQHCIGIWRKEKNTCPLCRVLIESGNRVLALDQILEKIESEMINQSQEFIAKREEQKKKHELMKNRERQFGDAEPSVARNFTRMENIEFEVVNGNLSQVRVQFDYAPLDINPEDAEFDRFRNAFNTNEDHERQEELL